MKNRQRQATQWLSFLATVLFLLIAYSVRNLFGSSTSAFFEAETPPIGAIEQRRYWNETFQYGFQGEKDDNYTNKAFSGVDTVAVDNRESVIFEDAKVRVSFYSHANIEEIKSMHNTDVPKMFSRLSRGIAVIEGDLESSSAKNILATLHTR